MDNRYIVSCPSCGKDRYYKHSASVYNAKKFKSTCKDCKSKKQREDIASIPKLIKQLPHYYGEENPMYGKRPYDIWLEKYGKEEADRRQIDLCLKKSLVKRGTKNSNYNHNLTLEKRNELRLLPQYQAFLKSIYIRDNYTCQICYNDRGGNLVGHHKNSYHAYPDLRMDFDNVICICEYCHKKFHNKYGYKNNTEIQFKEFIDYMNLKFFLDIL